MKTLKMQNDDMPLVKGEENIDEQANAEIYISEPFDIEGVIEQNTIAKKNIKRKGKNGPKDI